MQKTYNLEVMEGAELSSIDQKHLRTVMGHFPTGVTVVTGLYDGEPVGFTCQAFASLSLDPPLALIAPSKVSKSWPRIEASGAFSVNILEENQLDICKTFAISGTGSEKFDGVEWEHGKTGSPVLSNALAWAECMLEKVYEAGDHFVVVGKVVDAGAREGRPLVYFRGGFGQLSL